ncbi:MAG: type II toxin-antitoxin system VapC family toxin [Hyphomicrobium sp.]
MIVVDTNVVSALMRLDREPAVRAWLDRQPIEKLRVTAPTVFEIHYGLSALPAGRRRREMDARLADVMADVFANKVIPLDNEAARLAGSTHAEHVTNGRNVDVADSQIAGIARLLGAAIATRNTADFTGLGILLVNPWSP